MDRVRVGIIGGGRISDLHIPGYRNLPTAELVAVCDVREEVARRRAIEWGLSRFCTDYHDILNDPDIDMVEILAPHNLHAEMSIAAARARKHISVQKPMALTVIECDQMIEAAKKAGVKLKVYENFVFYPPYRKAKELMDAGEIGEPLSIRLHLGTALRGGWWTPLTTWMWHFTESECGSGPAIFDDGYHKFSLAIYFFGEVEKVYGWIDYSFAIVDEPSIISWVHKNGRRGYMDATLSPNLYVKSKYYSADERVEITGTKGIIWITRCTGQLLDVPPLILYRDGKTLSFNDIRADWQDSFTDSTRDFIDCILTGREPTLTGEKGKEVLRFALSAYESSRLRKEINPNDIK